MTHTLTFNQEEIEVLRVALTRLKGAIKSNIDNISDNDCADEDYKAGCLKDLGMADSMLLALPPCLPHTSRA